MRGARYVRLIPWTLHSGSEHIGITVWSLSWLSSYKSNSLVTFMIIELQEQQSGHFPNYRATRATVWLLSWLYIELQEQQSGHFPDYRATRARGWPFSWLQSYMNSSLITFLITGLQEGAPGWSLPDYRATGAATWSLSWWESYRSNSLVTFLIMEAHQ
jgi:hypothetical protein